MREAVRVHTRHSGTPQAHHAFKPVPGSKGLAPQHSATSGSARGPTGGQAVSRPEYLTAGPAAGYRLPALLPRRPVRWGPLGLRLTWARGAARAAGAGTIMRAHGRPRRGAEQT